ncbi:hypothetical protein GQ44DRAFT_707980 [Phaeosphaeriaceae sp. PMI808]|nr:hypothetical protein GQ44DRAFT_707980 [Phaeosphaeriaceae sp. PMI808]
MLELLDLSVELLICIASHLRQIDLLNISLTCKHLREATECELHREYRNRLLGYTHPVSKFVLRILRQPDLARYFKTVNVKGWDTLGDFNPVFYERIGDIPPQRKEKETEFLLERYQPSKDEYNILTVAAKAAGVINDIFPYEEESCVLKKVAPMLSTDAVAAAPNLFYTYIFDDVLPMDRIPHDRKFCQLLRAGVDDAYAMLLFALLPNVNDIFLRGACGHQSTLDWPNTKHGFKALRRLRVACIDAQLAWGVGYLNTLLSLAINLEELLLHNVASWFLAFDDQLDLDERARPVNLRPGSLNITKLEMISSALTKSDMSTLIRACRNLKSLHYYTDSEETGPYNFGPQDLIDILYPLKDTIEELYIEIIPYWADVLPERIYSLSHFTALRVLDSLPAMWDRMVDEDYDTDWRPLSDEYRLSTRLPASLTTLMFHGSKLYYLCDGEPVHPEQIIDVISHRRDLLPSLTKIFIGTDTELDAADFAGLHVFEDLLGGVQVDVAYGDEAQGPVVTFIDGIHPSYGQPIAKWFSKDKRYAIRKRKELAHSVAASNSLYNRPDNVGLTDQEIWEVIQQDKDIKKLFGDGKQVGFTEPEYESEDAEEQE